VKRLKSRRRGRARRSTPKKSAPPIRVEKAQTNRPPAETAHFMALSSKPRRSSRLEAHPKRRSRPQPTKRTEPSGDRSVLRKPPIGLKLTTGGSKHNHPPVLTTDHRFLDGPTVGSEQPRCGHEVVRSDRRVVLDRSPTGQTGSIDNRPVVHNRPPIGSANFIQDHPSVDDQPTVGPKEPPIGPNRSLSNYIPRTQASSRHHISNRRSVRGDRPSVQDRPTIGSVGSSVDHPSVVRDRPTVTDQKTGRPTLGLRLTDPRSTIDRPSV